MHALATGAIALLVAALVTVADKVLLALITVALLNGALAVVADDLGVALLTLAGRVLAVVAVAVDNLVRVLTLGAGLDLAVVTVADNALLFALGAVDLGGTVVTVAGDLLLVPLGSRADLGGDGLDLSGLGTDGTVSDGRGARGDGASGSAENGLRDGVLDADVHGQQDISSNSAASLGSLATAKLLGVARASHVAKTLVNLLAGSLRELIATVAVSNVWLVRCLQRLWGNEIDLLSVDTEETAGAAGGAKVQSHGLSRSNILEGREAGGGRNASVLLEVTNVLGGGRGARGGGRAVARTVGFSGGTRWAARR